MHLSLGSGHATVHRKKKTSTKKKAPKNAKVARVPGTRKSLAKSRIAKSHPVLMRWAHAAKQSYSDYKGGRIAGLHPGMEFRQLVSNSTYKAHVRNIAEKK